MLCKYYLEVFPRTLFLAIDETDEAIKEYLNGNEGDEIPKLDTNTNAYTLPVSDGIHGGSLIRFKDNSVVTPEIIVHECFHATCDFCDYLGININSESAAYMIQWCVNKIIHRK